MYTHISIKLHNPLSLEGRPLYLGLSPIRTGVVDEFESEADQAMRLAEALAALASAGITTNIHTQDELYSNESERIRALQEELDHADRRAAQYREELEQYRRDYQRQGEILAGVRYELDEIKLGPMDQRMVHAEGYLLEVQKAGEHHVHWGKFVEQIKMVRHLTRLGLKEAKDYVEAKSKVYSLGYQR